MDTEVASENLTRLTLAFVTGWMDLILLKSLENLECLKWLSSRVLKYSKRSVTLKMKVLTEPVFVKVVKVQF